MSANRNPANIFSSLAEPLFPTVDSLQQRFYPHPERSDPVVAFVRHLERVVKPCHDVLDLGAGAGELNSYALKGRVRRLVGIDRDPRVASNPLLDFGFRADMTELPFRNESFDVVFSIYVLEHVEHPNALVSEISRVLRPGGLCLALTPNLFHYVTMMARLTPMKFHRWFNEKRGRASEDTFPTFYRLNSRGALTRCFREAGFSTATVDSIEVQPNYLTFHAVAYALGTAFERIVNATELLSVFRVNLIGTFRKPACNKTLPRTAALRAERP